VTMGVHRRPDSDYYVVEVRWRGYPRIKLSTGTTSKTRARLIEGTLVRLRETGRRDIIELLVAGKLKLLDVHNNYLHDPASLEQPLTRETSPEVGPLVEEWLGWLRDPATISPRTRRPYAVQSIRRYKDSWEKIFKALPLDRKTPLGDLTRGSLVDYRAMRRRKGTTGSTLNRDVTAVQSFLRWAEEDRGLVVPHFRVPKEREAEGKERWLDAREIAKLEAAAPTDWWALFATLLYSGVRIAEAQGLKWADVRLVEQRIRIHERSGRRLKTASSQRDVPVPAPLVTVLKTHSTRVDSGPADLVFPPPYSIYWNARNNFARAVRLAGITPATIHDLRHTFAVHCAQAGVPLPRIQKLLGHATAVMTMRYMKHAPEAYFAEDAARIAKSMRGEGVGAEQGAQADNAGPNIRLA
jgi:integrase